MSGELGIGIATIVFMAVVQIAVSFIAYGGLRQKVNTAVDTMKWLSDNKVSKEEGAGFQAQLNRLERNDAECEGKLTAMREEFNSRFERMTNTLSGIEQTRSAESNHLSGAVAEIKATMLSMKESLARLEAEQLRLASAPPPQQSREMDILDTLRKAEEFKRMFAGLAKG